MQDKVTVVPCSGMGKVHGLLAREMALKVTGELCPEETELLCLAKIVTGDAEMEKRLSVGACVTIDGCPNMCAAKSVEHAGATVLLEYRIVDVLKGYRGVKPGGPTALSEEGWRIVDEATEMIAARVREIREE